MGYLCEFCGERVSVVFCRSDMASLCLSCDHNVHSANALSRRHSRTLICGRCSSQPALFRCVDEGISLCQNCDLFGHKVSDKTSSHKREAIRCYSGCPSVSEPSAMLPFLLDIGFVGDSACEHGIGSTSNGDKPDNGQVSKGRDKTENASNVVKAGTSHNGIDSSTFWLENVENLASYNSVAPKAFITGEEESTGFCDDFNMDEVELSIADYDSVFDRALNNPEQFFNDEDIDGLFGPNYMPGFNCQDVNPSKAFSDGVRNLRPECSKAASADSVISCKTEPNLFLTRQHSSMSFSGITGEIDGGGDHQDCGISPMPIAGAPPWLPPTHEISMPSSSRSDAVLRYKEKKKARKFEKKVRYASRKAMADVRRRVKGRFVKAGDAYDFDPLEETQIT